MKTGYTSRKQKKSLPSAGPHKRNPKELDRILDQAIEDAMPVSDPIATVMPEVKKEPERSRH